MEETHVHALDYLSVFRRRGWWLAVPIALSIVVGAILVKVLPKEYRSTATIGVTAPNVSPNFVSQSPLDNQERIRVLSQQLLSEPILSRVVKEEGLGSPSGHDGQQVAKIRRSIAVSVPDPVATTNEPRRLDTFVVSYADDDASRAQRVANRLVNVFVDESSKTRTARAEDTSAFIAAEQRSSQARLDALEDQLRRAKEAHMGQLPEQTQANLQTLSGLRQQLGANATALQSEQDRLSTLERQIDGMNKGSSDVVFVPGSGGTAQVQSPETRVMALERELADARMMYTDRHPEVQRLQDELKTARQEVTAEKQKPASDRISQLQVDPAYRQLAADREMSRLRVRDLQRTEADTQRQIGVYQARIESAPMVEEQLGSLQRDYDLEKQQYSELSGKLHAATIAENIERNGHGEEFTVLYGASLPADPIKPVPWRVMLVSIMVGICLGGAATFAREYLDRSVHDVRDLKDEFELPVLGEVSRIKAA